MSRIRVIFSWLRKFILTFPGGRRNFSVFGCVFGVLEDFQGDQKYTFAMMLFQEGLYGVEDVLGNSFGRATFQWIGSEGLGKSSRQFLGYRVGHIVEKGVVEVFHQPIPDKSQIRKVYHESRFIQLMTSKGEFKGPVVPVYERAMAGVVGLAMGKGDVAIGL